MPCTATSCPDGCSRMASSVSLAATRRPPTWRMCVVRAARRSGAREHVLLPAAQPDQSPRVAAGQVAGGIPVRAERLAGLVGIVPVAGHEVGAAREQLADFVVGARLAVRAPDGQLDVGDGPADRA